MEQSIIIDTRAAVIICPNPEKAAEYIRELLDNGLVSLSVVKRPTSEVRRFLAGEKIDKTDAVVEKNGKIQKVKAPDPAPKKQAAPQTGRPTGNKRAAVLKCLTGISEAGALDAAAICKRTKLPASSIAPILTELSKAGAVGRADVKPFKYFGLPTTDAASDGDEKVECKARGRVIKIDDCKPNESSPACRACSAF